MSRSKALLDTQCPVCDSGGIEECLRVDDVPVYCNVLHPTRDAALAAPTDAIALSFCTDCGHLFNAAFDGTRVTYDAGYENSLHFSVSFHRFARELANELVERHRLRGKRVLEIGCGKGDFLQLLLAAGAGSAVGVDPSYDLGRHPEIDPRIEIVREYFGEGAACGPYDFVCCRHVLEHVAVPYVLLEALREAQHDDAVPIYFEVPDGSYMLREHAIWDLIYEHCGYFTAASLHRVFGRAGLTVTGLGHAFEGQYLQLHALTGSGGDGISPPSRRHLVPLIGRFSRAFEEKRARWVDRLDAEWRSGRRVALWGAGSKGTTFLNVLRARETVECVVDVNPHKQGRYVPGTGHEVIAPDALPSRAPDVLVVMNPIYRSEIELTVRQLGMRAELVVAS